MLRLGREPLHATAVLADRGVVAFFGASGQGKSTLGALFVRGGRPLLTDDMPRSRFRTRVPERVVARLGEPRAPEPSEAYLRRSRRWHHELLSNLGGLGRPSARARLLREVLVPGPRYMLDSYGFGAIGYVLLPALYVHRVVTGVWKILRGRK